MKKKTDNQKLQKTGQQNTEVETAYLDFYQAYNSLPPSSSAAMESLTKEAAKKTKDMEFFKQFFESNEKLPEFIRPEHLRNLLGKRPETFCWFLKYPTFLDMLLGVSPDCEAAEKARGESFIEGLKIKVEKELDRINKSIEERSKGLAERNAEIDKIKAEINKGSEEIDKINTEINKGKKDVAKGNAEISKIKERRVKRSEEIDKITAIDKRNKEEKDIWLNLQKAINIYINAPKLYSELMEYVLSGAILDIGVIQGWSEKLIKYLLEKDPLPPYIEQGTLHKIILRAPVTMSVFFQHPNFFKRLIGFSPDNTKDDDGNEKWKNFRKMFTFKLDAIRSPQQTNPNPTMLVSEQLTQSRYKEIFEWIHQNQKLVDEQAEEKIYEKNCQDFATAINVSFAATKNFMATHPNPLGSEFIEKELPSCLTTKLLKKLVTFAPEYAIRYMDNYYFMARLVADEVKKGNTLMADDLFDDLQNKFALVNFSHKDKLKLLLKHWEIRLRLHLGITLLIREMVKLISQAVSGKDFKEGKSEEDILNLADKKVLSTVTKKLNELLIDVSSSTEYEWIDELKAFVTKLSKSLSNVSLLTNNDSMPVYKEIRSIIDEINSYLSNENLVKEIKTRAQSLRQENISNVVANVDEYSSSANAFKP